MKVEFKITHWLTGSVLFKCEAETLKEAVCAAIRSNADLSNADLSNADLRYADLSNANLRYADLSNADLSNADLRYADLSNADLRNADLSNADLRYANLSNANLSNADLRYADLSNADLRDVKEAALVLARLQHIPTEGPFIGWKKCNNAVLVKLGIPSSARRSHGTGRKCRAEHAKVLEVIGAEVGISQHDGKTEYRVGKMVRCDKWDENRWNECSGGIHFFLTKEEAQAY